MLDHCLAGVHELTQISADQALQQVGASWVLTEVALKVDDVIIVEGLLTAKVNISHKLISGHGLVHMSEHLVCAELLVAFSSMVEYL